MITAVDSSVILDVLADSDNFTRSSEGALKTADSDGKLIICDCVLAEIYPSLNDEVLFREFLSDWKLEYIPSSKESALLAGKYFALYLSRGGSKKQTIPDFLIGAHAFSHAERLLARDRGYLRKYFTGLQVWDPSI
ncbi:MAG TPA: PIN domain-containing protein [Spirochaetes bacterium]|nr:PIN domain-containing protein [Spirochaetota bacterium]